jgi:hypothetical protein
VARGTGAVTDRAPDLLSTDEGADIEFDPERLGPDGSLSTTLTYLFGHERGVRTAGPRTSPTRGGLGGIGSIGDQFVSAFTIAEIERGVLARERSDAQQGAVLRRWLEVVVCETRRCSPSTVGTARAA